LKYGPEYLSLCKEKHTNHFGISFSHSGTSGAIERIFSITNASQTDDENRFLVEIIEAVIVTKTCFWDLSFNDFYTLLSNNSKLLQAICSSQKYRISA
jgi:hypothetical protein